jgi:hypothetical protein
MSYNFEEEANLTNEQLSDELAKLTPLTAKELNKLLPRKVDKKRLTQIIKIVNSSTSKQNKLASLQANFTELGDVVLKLLTKYLV